MIGIALGLLVAFGAALLLAFIRRDTKNETCRASTATRQRSTPETVPQHHHLSSAHLAARRSSPDAEHLSPYKQADAAMSLIAD